ncbi:MAG: hypothetical protein ACK50N_06085, partial [Flavobacteriales bacterium]
MKQFVLAVLMIFNMSAIAQNLQWVKGISSVNNITPYQVVVDSESNVYEIGRFNGMADFDPSANVYMVNSGASTSGNVGSIYVTKQDANGNLLWAKTIGAVASISEIQLKPAICVDSENNVYITGFFFQTVDLNPDAGVYNLFSTSGQSYFLTKWDTNGSFQWATQFCAGVDIISLDPLAIKAFGNNVYVAGTFTGNASFQLFTNTFATNTNNVYGGYGEVFVVSINSNGTIMNWAKTFGNPDNDNQFSSDKVKDIIVDSQGNLYILGSFIGTLDAFPGAGLSNITGASNEYTPFLVKLNSAGNYVAAKSFLNASEIQINYSPMQNTIVLGGQFKNNLDVAINTASNIISSTNNVYNAFFCSYNSDLELNWVNTIDWGPETFNGIAMDDNGNTYVTGAHTAESDLDVNQGTYYDPIMGVETNYYDCYLMKLDYFGEITWIRTFNHCYAAIPLFRQLVSMPNGNFVGYGLAIGNETDLNLLPNVSSYVSLDLGYTTTKAVYDACAIIEEMPSITGPESADPSSSITLSIANIPAESYIDWMIPEDWQITNTTSNTVTLETGNISGNVICIISDLCGNTTPINFYILINDPNNPNTGEYSFRLVKDINAVSFDIDGSRPKDFIALNDMTYFIAEEGSQLWKTDGTESGTTDVLASTDITAERIIGVFQNKLVIIGQHPTLGEEIWLSNGTASGTTLLTEIIPGLGYPNFSTFTIGGNYMYFLANNNTNGQEWWVTNGTTAGTYMVADLSPSSFFGLGATPVFFGDANAFGAIANTIDRKDLWIIGPNQGQATNLTEQFPALYYTGLNVSNLVVVNNLLFFDFYSGNEGDELFISDGTISGTFMYELFPGNTSAYPEDFMVVGNTIIMNAYT